MKLKCQGVVAMIGGKQVTYVIIFLVFWKSFHCGHLSKNDQSLPIITDTVNQWNSMVERFCDNN